jgi:hypothetical protein
LGTIDGVHDRRIPKLQRYRTGRFKLIKSDSFRYTGNLSFAAALPKLEATKMPKYYFDLVDGARLVDPFGLDCRDDHDANAKAKIIAKQTRRTFQPRPYSATLRY